MRVARIVSMLCLAGLGLSAAFQPASGSLQPPHEQTVANLPWSITTVDASVQGQRTAIALRSQPAPPAPSAETGDLLSQLPLYFIENRGQIGSDARYYVQGRDRTLTFSPNGVIFRLAGAPAHIVALQFSDADPDVQPEGFGRAELTVNYFVGPPGRWHTGLPAYAGVLYRDLWPGIDLIWQGESGRLKQLFRIQPGADPGQIALIYRGALALAVEPSGSLLVTIPTGSFRDSRPYAWQEVDGAAFEVTAAYQVTAAEENAWAYSFDLGAYDPTLPLLLDPELFLYAGYIGGDMDDEATAVAVDSLGNTYITGTTASTEASFPDGDGFGALPGPDRTFNGNSDAFVAKVRDDGQALLYAGCIGGRWYDYGFGIAVDSARNAYVTGNTGSPEDTFPDGDSFGAVPGPDRTFNGGYDAYVVQVRPDGSGLGWASYIGGDEDEDGAAVAVDTAGNVRVAGATESGETTFPDGDGFGALAGLDRTFNGSRDAFVVAIGPGLSVQSLYLPLVLR